MRVGGGMGVGGVVMIAFRYFCILIASDSPDWRPSMCVVYPFVNAVRGVGCDLVARERDHAVACRYFCIEESGNFSSKWPESVNFSSFHNIQKPRRVILCQRKRGDPISFGYAYLQKPKFMHSRAKHSGWMDPSTTLLPRSVEQITASDIATIK